MVPHDAAIHLGLGAALLLGLLLFVLVIRRRSERPPHLARAVAAALFGTGIVFAVLALTAVPLGGTELFRHLTERLRVQVHDLRARLEGMDIIERGRRLVLRDPPAPPTARPPLPPLLEADARSTPLTQEPATPAPSVRGSSVQPRPDLAEPERRVSAVPEATESREDLQPTRGDLVRDAARTLRDLGLVETTPKVDTKPKTVSGAAPVTLPLPGKPDPQVGDNHAAKPETVKPPRVETKVTDKRVEPAERVERVERAERTELADRPERVERADRIERAERPERVGRPERLERVDRVADRIDRLERRGR